MIEVVPARPQHVGSLAHRLRKIDEVECKAMGSTVKDALRQGLTGSTLVWTVKIDGRPEAMMGATPISLVDGIGRPWMLMTDVAAAQRKALLRLGRIYTDAMHRQYALLDNWVHADNAPSIRWLSRLGYAVGAVDVIGGEPMRRFIRQRT